ncbi:MAG: Gfo/Idh/MocA family protein [Tuberibacillus sp.]
MINIGLVGFGFIGKTHLEAYQQLENARVTKICTSHIPATRDEAFVTDFDDLLKDDRIDIVDICLPTYLHEEYIVRAAKAGKHIICEKPLTLSVESAKRIIHAVQQCNVKLFVGHVLRFWPEYRLIKAYSDSGKLQEIEVVHAQRLSQAPGWSEWFRYPDQSGGALYDLHLHDIDFVYYLLGKPKSIHAVGKKNRYGAWDHVMTTLSFEGDRIAYVEASHRMPAGFPFTMTFRAQSNQSALDFQMAAGVNIENLQESRNLLVYYSNQTCTHVNADSGDPFQHELSYFLHCLEKNQENRIIPLDDVLFTLELLNAIETSLNIGRVIHI